MNSDGSRPYHSILPEAAFALAEWADREAEPVEALAARLADAERLLGRVDVEWVRGHYCAGSGGRKTPTCGCG